MTKEDTMCDESEGSNLWIEEQSCCSIVSTIPLSIAFSKNFHDDARGNNTRQMELACGKSKTLTWWDDMSVQGWKTKNNDLQEAQQPRSSSFTSNTICDTYLHHLNLGDTASPQDMSTEYDPSKIDSLQVHDFAFVLRNDDNWTYAIIADRQDDVMLFVVDIEGSTKMLSRKHWSIIRLVNTINKNTALKPQISPPSAANLPDENGFKVTAYPIEMCPPAPPFFCRSPPPGRADLRRKKGVRRRPHSASATSTNTIGKGDGEPGSEILVDGVLSMFD